MNTFRLSLLYGSFIILCTSVTNATVTLNKLFTDGMVLQCNTAYDQRPFIYGTAAVNETVIVNRTSSGGNVQSYQAVADTTMFWIVTLNANSCTDTDVYTFSIAGSSDYGTVLTISNVVYGDVLLCSGQSNMVFSVKSDLQAANFINQTFPNIRLFPIVQAPSETPQNDVPAYYNSSTPCWWPQNPKPWNSSYKCNSWQVASPGITDEFSAVCFFTAYHLTLTFPTRVFGLVYGAYDGTPMQAWSPPEALAKCSSTSTSNSSSFSVNPVTAPLLAPPLANGMTPNDPMVLFNAMINPVIRFAIRSYVWYQGESDSGDTADVFACKFQALIESWRRRSRIGDAAFNFVQLAPQDSGYWPQYYIFNARLGQALALPSPGTNTTDTTGMVPSYDLGDMGSPYPPSHVHPRHKVLVGARMAAAILHSQYAWQWPSGGANLTGFTVNWRGPAPINITASTVPLSSKLSHLRSSATPYTLLLDTLDNLGIYMNDTIDCWECCANGRDTIQLSDPSGATWINATFTLSSTNNNSVIVTPLGNPPSAGFTQIRYAPNLWTQCAIYAVGNQIPMAPFLINISSPADPVSIPSSFTSTDYRTVRAQMEEKRKKAIPTASFGPRTWKTWKGFSIPERDTTVPFATPAMGFNSWNAFHCNVDENVIRKTADAFITLGLSNFYSFINLDDCWAVDRYPNGTIIEDPVRFPSSMKEVANYVHSKGFKFGVYSAQKSLTCQQRPGSYQHESIDIKTYCDWEIDYLKVDQCGGIGWPNLNTSWIAFREGITNCVENGGSPILLSVESCSVSNYQDCQAWIPQLANSWRTTGDIQATWESILSNLDMNNGNGLPQLAGPGHFNDADMLQVGNPGLSFNEQQAHFFAWCIIASPLLIGTDLTSGIDNATLAILTAPEVIAVNQDKLAVQGIKVSPNNLTGTECWAKPLADGTVAALLLNRGEVPSIAICTWLELGLPSPQGTADVRDLWNRVDLGSFTAQFSSTINGHSAIIIRVSP